MPLWGKNDKSVTNLANVESSSGAPIGTYTAVKLGGGANAHFSNTTNSRGQVDAAMFNNTSIGAFLPNVGVGVFGVSATEVNNTTGQLATAYVIFSGSGYSANAAVTLTVINGGSGSSGVVNATANSTGRISALNIQTVGSGYKVEPTVAIAAPTPISFAGNSTSVTIGTSSNTGWITLGANTTLYSNGDLVTYTVAAGNTAIGGLTNNINYYIYQQNTSTVLLSATAGGAFINLSSVAGGVQSGHSFTGQTATGTVSVSANGTTGVTHAGWVIRREGTGGRANRVTYETLIAMGSLGAQTSPYGTAATSNDAPTDNTIFPGV
jgi:hypothetical protein